MIEHLLAFVMGGKEARKWANKILLYSKMYKNFENFDYLLTPEEKEENSQLFKSAISTTIIELDLKLICFFIYVAMLYYYGKVDEFYKKFDQSNKYMFMTDKNKIKLDFDKRHMFTGLFRFTLLLFLRKRATHPIRLQLFAKIFDHIFEEEMSSKLDDIDPKLVWSMEDVLENAHEFCDLKKHYFGAEKGPRKREGMIKFVKDYVELLTRDPGGRQYIVYGEPDTQKSRFVELLGYLESNMKQINFGLFWFNMESLNNEAVFGSPNYVGILREIFL